MVLNFRNFKTYTITLHLKLIDRKRNNYFGFLLTINFSLNLRILKISNEKIVVLPFGPIYKNLKNLKVLANLKLPL